MSVSSNEFSERLKEFVDDNYKGVSSGMNVIVGNNSFESQYHTGEIPELSFIYEKDTVYDVASLTKPVVTATLIMKLVESGKLSLEDSLGSLGLYDSSLIISNLTIRQLITHTSGLIPTFPLYKYGQTKLDYLRTIGLMHEHGKVPLTEEYSDLNFILLGFIIEEVLSDGLDKLAEKFIFSPLGMNHSGFNVDFPKEKIAPTEIDKMRGGVVWGKVHDEKSFYLDGKCGHAGLFTNGPDLSKFVKGLIKGDILKKNTLREMISPQNFQIGGMFGLGWMIKLPKPVVPSPSFGYNAFMGETVHNGAYGHTGFTGTSICIDPSTSAYSIVLSNRVYPTRDNLKILGFRRHFHNFVFAALNSID
jgi:CubicO group peptidase (beta-lactamase class C family)